MSVVICVNCAYAKFLIDTNKYGKVMPDKREVCVSSPTGLSHFARWATLQLWHIFKEQLL